MTGILITGHYFVAAFSSWAFFSIQKIILQTERTVCTDFKNIFNSFPKKVWLLDKTVEIEVSLECLEVNDVIVVRAGETIAIDGVFASTILLSGYLQIQVNKQGTETIAGKIVDVLENTVNFKTNIQSRGDAIVESGAEKTLWMSALSLPIIGLSHTLALSYAGFGYQMRLAAPLMVLNYLRVLSHQSILVKDGRALELLHQIDVFIFDKTGTLTQEIPEIVQIIPSADFAKISSSAKARNCSDSHVFTKVLGSDLPTRDKY
ncbi:MAG: hypothetical protein Q9M50_07230 [Methylococcales bacterium]|nr:hypothetical protein [Methylococcales bacterium]